MTSKLWAADSELGKLEARVEALEAHVATLIAMLTPKAVSLPPEGLYEGVTNAYCGWVPREHFIPEYDSEGTY